MKGSEKAIVLGVVMAVILAVFYLKVLSPKREQASSLGDDITKLESQIDEQRQTAQYGEQARQEFPTYYGRLVVLGKAVPARADTASLMVQLGAIAHRTDVQFRGISLGAGSGDVSATAAPPTSPSGSTSSTGTTSTTSTTSTTPAPSGSSTTGSSTATPASSTATPAPATEAGAASMPIGAVVGSAGLPTMPYDLTFTGTYFNVADFLKGVDDLVHLRGSTQVAADGRLMTINGFSLSSPLDTSASPKLKVTLSVTSYVTPAAQGLTAGASPNGPGGSVTQPQTQPTSATVSP
jgi:Tfp pilus assembly protein PilO